MSTTPLAIPTVSSARSSGEGGSGPGDELELLDEDDDELELLDEGAESPL